MTEDACCWVIRRIWNGKTLYWHPKTIDSVSKPHGWDFDWTGAVKFYDEASAMTVINQMLEGWGECHLVLVGRP